MGEAGNLSVFSFIISIGSHCTCWLAHIGGGVEQHFCELYMLFTFKFSENYGTFVLYTAEWIWKLCVIGVGDMTELLYHKMNHFISR